jgi:ribokinase
MRIYQVIICKKRRICKRVFIIDRHLQDSPGTGRIRVKSSMPPITGAKIMNERPAITVVGSLNMDLVVNMPAIPRPGESLLGGRFATYPGGKGANQAVAAARLGARVKLIGRLGGDAFGQQLRGILQDEEIDVSEVSIDEQAPTGVALITVDTEGNNSISVASGANYTLTPAHVVAAFDRIEQLDWLVMPLETPLDTVLEAARLARDRGARVILNPAPAQSLPEDLVQLINVLVPNEHEAAALTSLQIDDPDAAGLAAARLAEMIPMVLITLGERGVLLIEHGDAKPQPIPAYPVQAVDTTAAGDAFVGALAVALGEGHDLLAAARFASAAAAISVSRPGAQPSLPYRAEVDLFLRERENTTRDFDYL